MNKRKFLNITLCVVLGLSVTLAGCSKKEKAVATVNAGQAARAQATQSDINNAKANVPASDDSGKTLTDADKNDATNAQLKREQVDKIINEFVDDYYNINDGGDKLMGFINKNAVMETKDQFQKVVDTAKKNHYTATLNSTQTTNYEFKKFTYNGKNYDGAMVTIVVQYKEAGDNIKDQNKLKENSFNLQFINNGAWEITGLQDIYDKVIEQ